MNFTSTKHKLTLKTKFLRGAALGILASTFGSALNAHAYDVCSDDITGDETSCVHEDMAKFGHYVYNLDTFVGNTGDLVVSSGVQDGAGHEDEKDHVGGRTGGSLTVGHFWNPDPNILGVFQYFDPEHRQGLDGIAALVGTPLNNWQKSQAYWSRSLAEYAFENFDDQNGAYHFLGHVVHHMGDNTVPTHAHVTSHAPGGRDSYEDWMSNKYHIFTGNVFGDTDIRVERATNNHHITSAEYTNLTAEYVDELDRIDPWKYANLNFDIPEIAGDSESPFQKLLWLQYTTNQIAEFFAADRDDGEAIDPSPGNWVQGDLNKMTTAMLRPTTADELDNSDSCDCDEDGYLRNIRKYSYIRGLRAIGGLYNLFEQTVRTEQILTVDISYLRINEGDCDDLSALPACEAFAEVTIGNISARNQGHQKELAVGDSTSNLGTWRWGNTVRDASSIYPGNAFVQIDLIDEDIRELAFNPDDVIDISSDGSSSIQLLVNIEKCNAGEAGAVIPFPGRSSSISGYGRCGETMTSVAGDGSPGGIDLDGEYDSGATSGATISFSIDIHDITDDQPPVINCAMPDGMWHDDNVGIACTASDIGVGLTNAADASFTLYTNVPGGVETASAGTNTRIICDTNDNCITAGPVFGNQIDRKAPVISIAQPLPVEYVHSDTLTLNYTVTDGGSGVDTVARTLNGSPTFGGADLASGQSINLLTDLPLGAHNFTVNADDNVGNQSATASVDFSIIVTPESIMVAVDQFSDSGAVHRKLVNSLQSKLKNAQKKWNRGQCKASRNIYGAFINEVRAQTGKSITGEAAGILTADAMYLIDNCEG